MQTMEVIYSKRRTLSLQIADDGHLIVRAPQELSDAEVRRIVADKQDWIARKRAQLAQGKHDWGGEVLTTAELEGLKRAARDDFSQRVAHFAPLVGVQPQALSVRAQHSRWGSCSSKGSLSLNALLMLAPEAVRDYVVVHELCHLKEMNHSARFWAEVERVLPDYRTWRDWLKVNGHALLQRNPKS